MEQTQVIEPHDLPQLLIEAASYLSSIQDEVNASRDAAATHEREKLQLNSRIQHLETKLAHAQTVETALNAQLEQLRQQQHNTEARAVGDSQNTREQMRALELQLLEFEKQQAGFAASQKARETEYQQLIARLQQQLAEESSKRQQLEERHAAGTGQFKDVIKERDGLKKALRKTRSICEAMQNAFKRAKRDGKSDLPFDALTANMQLVSDNITTTTDPMHRSGDGDDKYNSTSGEASGLQSSAKNNTTSTRQLGAQTKTCGVATTGGAAPTLKPPENHLTSIDNHGTTSVGEDRHQKDDVDAHLITQPEQHLSTHTGKVLTQLEPCNEVPTDIRGKQSEATDKTEGAAGDKLAGLRKHEQQQQPERKTQLQSASTVPLHPSVVVMDIQPYAANTTTIPISSAGITTTSTQSGKPVAQNVDTKPAHTKNKPPVQTHRTTTAGNLPAKSTEIANLEKQQGGDGLPIQQSRKRSLSVVLNDDEEEAVQQPEPKTKHLAIVAEQQQQQQQQQQRPAKMKSPAWKSVNRVNEPDQDNNDKFDFSPPENNKNKPQFVETTTIAYNNNQPDQQQQQEVRPATLNQKPPVPPPQQQNQGEFRYQQVVRKKEEREKLPAFECEACQRFYAAMEGWGSVPLQALPTCGHINNNATATTTTTGGVTNGATKDGLNTNNKNGGNNNNNTNNKVSGDDMRQHVGRHRYNYKPPSTPVGFWDMDTFSPDGGPSDGGQKQQQQRVLEAPSPF